MLARSSMLSTLLTVHLWLLDFNSDETSLIYAWLSLTPETGGVWNMWNLVLRMVVLHRYGHWGVYHLHLLNLVELSWCVNVRYLARADSMTDVYKSTTATMRVTYPYFGFWKTAKCYLPLFPHQFNRPRVFAQSAQNRDCLDCRN